MSNVCSTAFRPTLTVGLGALVFALAATAAPAGTRTTHTTIRNSSDLGPSFAYVHVNGNTVNMSGDERDAEEARALQRSKGDNYLWVRRDEERFLIRDAVLLRKLGELEAPMLALGEAQGALGTEQASLGEAQAKVGELQARLGEKQARIGEMMSRGWNDKARMERLSEEMRALSEEQSRLGHQQSRMGIQQTSIGRRQSEFGRRQSVASREFQRGLAQMVADAERRGLTERL